MAAAKSQVCTSKLLGGTALAAALIVCIIAITLLYAFPVTLSWPSHQLCGLLGGECEDSSCVKALSAPPEHQQELPPFANARVLMIVAHPDDEVLFGAPDLLFARQVHVLCLTNAANAQRAKEFHTVINSLRRSSLPSNAAWASRSSDSGKDLASGCKEQCTSCRGRVSGQMLDLPDGKHRSWNHDDAARACVSALAQTRGTGWQAQFDVIVTHGADGEYGHFQHRAVHMLCTENIGPKARLPVASFESRWRGYALYRSRESDVPSSQSSIKYGCWAFPAWFWVVRRRLLHVYRNQTGVRRWYSLLHRRIANTKPATHAYSTIQ